MEACGFVKMRELLICENLHTNAKSAQNSGIAKARFSVI